MAGFGNRFSWSEARRLADRLLASDPGFKRLRNAIRIVLVVAAAALVSFPIVSGGSAIAPLFGGVVGLLATMVVGDDELRQRKTTTLLLFAPAALSATLGALLSSVAWLQGLALLVFVFLALYLRRFGPRYVALGMMALIPLFLSSFVGYGVVITAFVVFMGSGTLGDTISRGVQRTVGTLLGAAVGLLLATLASGNLYLEVPLIVACVFLAFYLFAVSQALMIFWITVMLALVFDLIGQLTGGILALRSLDTLVGGAIGLAVSALVLPTRTGDKIREGTIDFLGALKGAGYEPPMVPIRHQRVTTAYAPGIPEHHPVVRVTDLSCYLRPENGGYLHGIFEPDPIACNLEDQLATFRTRDVEYSVRTMAQAHERLAALFPILEDLGIEESKRGLTTFAPDGAYLVGPVPKIDNLFLATGCASLGIAGSAAVGRWLANWVTQGEPGEDLSAVDLERFGQKGRDREWVRKESKKFYANYYSIPSMAVT